MIPLLAVFVVLLGEVNQGMAACKGKPPMANYTADLITGKFYLIITKPSFDIQNKQLQCGTQYIMSAVPSNFPLYLSYQESDGTITNSTLRVTNLSPPGTLHVSAEALSFQATVIGAIKDKVNIFYACNTKNGKEAVWVYYHKRNNGRNMMDDASTQYTFETLAQNRISVYGFKLANNKKCNN